jgi:hypothetical protein
MLVRAGYGLVWFEQAGISTPFTTPYFPFIQTVTARTLDNVKPAFVLADGPSTALGAGSRITPLPFTPDAGLGQGVFAVDRDLGSGFVQQWHVAWQRAFTSRVMLELAYVASNISRLGVPDTNINQLTVDQLALGPALVQPVANPLFGKVPRASSLGDPTIPLAQLLRPFPEHTTVSLYRNNVGRSRYRGFAAKIERRFSRGVSFQVSYTRSRLEDDASSVFDAAILTGPPTSFPAADSHNRALEWDVSNGDIPHAFAANAMWETPFGAARPRRLSGILGALANDWTVTAVVMWQSGVPLTVTQATNFNAFAGFGTQRPNVSGTPTLPAADRGISRWFDTSVFSIAPQFTIGNSSRNPVRGPDYRNVDLGLIRRVPLPRMNALELRAEVFNLVNTPPLGTPNTVLGTPGFGSITSAGDPRVVQLALKLWF